MCQCTCFVCTISLLPEIFMFIIKGLVYTVQTFFLQFPLHINRRPTLSQQNSINHRRSELIVLCRLFFFFQFRIITNVANVINSDFNEDFKLCQSKCFRKATRKLKIEYFISLATKLFSGLLYYMLATTYFRVYTWKIDRRIK